MIWLLASLAAAQSPGDGLPDVDGDPLRITVDSAGALATESARLQPGTSASLHFRHSDDLVVQLRSNGERIAHLGAVTAVQASAAWSNERWRLGASVPAALRISGDNAPDGITAVGDISLDAKLGGFLPADGAAAFAVVARVGVPTGGGGALYGSAGLWAEPALALELGSGALRASANLGTHLVGRRDIGSTTTGPSLVYRGALVADLGQSWRASAELWGRSRFSGTSAHPLEGLATIRRTGASASAYLGGGAGLVSGIGAPQWRVVAGVTLRGAPVNGEAR